MNRRDALGICSAAAATALAGCLGSDWETTGRAVSSVRQGLPVALEPFADGFTEPVAIAFATDGIQYVADKRGTVHLLEDGDSPEQPFLDVRDELVDRTSIEQGLVGLTLHPEFTRNGRFYLRYSAPPREGSPDSFSHTFRLSEFRATEDLRETVPGSERVVLEIPQPGRCHQSGSVTFGPNGYLYVGVGDGGSSRRVCPSKDTGPGHARDWYQVNTGGNGQDITENLHGSILRIDVDSSEGGKPYAVPADNPLVGNTGLDEQFAWGFRNPYGMSFDGGRLLVADVGRNNYEEINAVRRGGNYGWNVKEGSKCLYANRIMHVSGSEPHPLLAVPVTVLSVLSRTFLEPFPACPTTTPGGVTLRDPVVVYPHERDGRRFGDAVIGGYVCKSASAGHLEGKYVFGDFTGLGEGYLFATQTDESTEKPWPIEMLPVTGRGAEAAGGALLSFGRDPDGNVYALTTGFSEGSGAVYRLTPGG